jgi:hypothetical protein
LEGETFCLRESAVYEAAEVREETDTDTPEFGDWVPVTPVHKNGDDRGHDGWAVAVGELIECLQQSDADLTTVPFTITRCQKSGSAQTDPYEVSMDVHSDADERQTGLGN